MRRFTSPKERIAARNRLVKIVYRDGLVQAHLDHKCLPREVESTVARLIQRGCRIVRVDGATPPPGASGECFYDHDDSGPYWKEDL